MSADCNCQCHLEPAFSGYHEFMAKGLPLNKKHGKIATFINKIIKRKTEYI